MDEKVIFCSWQKLLNLSAAFLKRIALENDDVTRYSV